MESIKDSLKGIDLEELRQRVSSLSSTSKPEPAQTPKYRCNKCKDEEGYLERVWMSEEKFDYRDVWRDCSCKISRRAERLMKSSNITAKFRAKTFNSFTEDGRPEVVRKAYKAAWNYISQFNYDSPEDRESVALLGRPGSGKTHLLMAISNHLIANGVGVIYFPWVEGFNELRGNLDTLDTRIKALQQAEVLFLDDLFKGQELVPGKEPTKFQLEQLFAIINYRYLENKPILVSSEKTIAQFCGFDEAIGSRINEMCRDYKVILSGGIELNYRLQ